MSGPGSTTALASAFNLARIYPAGWHSGSFRNDEGRDIYYAKADAEGPVQGTVVFTTGYGDSINFHYDAIRNWQERGFEVYAMDWIGQGLSDRENPHDVTDSNDRLMTRHMNDLHKFVSEVVPSNTTHTLYLASHSMGGHIGMMYLKAHPETFDRAVLAAPLIDLNTNVLPRTAFKGIAHAATAIGLGDHPLPNWRSLLNRASAVSDNMRELSAEPEKLTLTQAASEKVRQLLKPVEVDLPTWNWIRRIYPSLDKMHRQDYFADIKTPVLFIAAGRDELVSNKAIHFAASRIPGSKVLDLPTSEHGVWNSSSINRARLWDSIDSFTQPDTGTIRTPESAPVRRPTEPARPEIVRPAFSPAFA